MNLQRYTVLLSLTLIFSSVEAQAPVRYSGIQISTEEDDTPATDSTVTTDFAVEGEKYDTAIFDSTWRVPFKIHENRGEEMIHSWISLGAPKAPHLYLGAGIYHFDKSGMSDIQFGWYPLLYPYHWEFYFAAERMFFLRKRSKEVKVGICIDEEYRNGLRVHYRYNAKLRRDKFYGITTGIAYEGMLNPSHKTVYLYRGVTQSGEDYSLVLKKYTHVQVRVGLSRLRCKNVEYETPFKRKLRCRGSTMSRVTLGIEYFPVLKFELDHYPPGSERYAYQLFQKQFAFYFAWEGRVAFQNMKRECGLHMNLMFVAPSWNRETDYRFAFTNTWGFYFSLDRKNPRWKERRVG